MRYFVLPQKKKPRAEPLPRYQICCFLVLLFSSLAVFSVPELMFQDITLMWLCLFGKIVAPDASIPQIKGHEILFYPSLTS
jgi:hypothetical protein